MADPAIPSSGGFCTADVELTIHGRRLNARVKVPDRAVRPAELLSFYRMMSDGLMSLAVRDAQAAGSAISCKAGCGACCRQLVPISAVEARHLAKLIESMPEPRRTEVRGRFAAVRVTLEKAGLLPRLLHPQDFPDEQMRELNLEYWDLRVPCPFLEDESCSIHKDRPIACREFLVTSDARHCAEPRPDNVRPLDPPGGPITMRLPRDERSPAGHPIHWVTLALAPDFVAEHPQEPPARHATTLVRDFLEGMSKR
jgi:Fe-S-cluster containining protein